jgi:hypothetical protein
MVRIMEESPQNKEEEFPQKKEEDFPQSIIVLLVVLAVVISVLSTFTVLNEINKQRSAYLFKENNQNSFGEIRLEVQDPNALPNSATGRIIFKIEETQPR